MNDLSTLLSLIETKKVLINGLEDIQKKIINYEEKIKNTSNVVAVEEYKKKKKQCENVEILIRCCIRKVDVCIEKDRNGEDYYPDFMDFVLIVEQLKIQNNDPY